MSFFIEVSEKIELKSLYTNLSAVLCNPFIRLLSILLCGSSKLMGSIQIEIEDMHSLKVFFELISSSFLQAKKIRAIAWIFLLALLQKYVACSLKLSFLSIITPNRFPELHSQMNNQLMKVLLLCQDWRENDTYRALP